MNKVIRELRRNTFGVTTSSYLPGSLQGLLGSVSGEAGGNNTSELDSLGTNDLAVDTSDALRTIDQDLINYGKLN